MTKSERWILSEYLVANDRIENHGDALVYHQRTTPYAELDLVFDSPAPLSRRANLASPLASLGRSAESAARILTIIEVKSVLPGLWAHDVISRKQRLRLERARWYVELQSRRPTRLLLATVQTRRQGPVIRYFDAPF